MYVLFWIVNSLYVVGFLVGCVMIYTGNLGNMKFVPPFSAILVTMLLSVLWIASSLYVMQDTYTYPVDGRMALHWMVVLVSFSCIRAANYLLSKHKEVYGEN